MTEEKELIEEEKKETEEKIKTEEIECTDEEKELKEKADKKAKKKDKKQEELENLRADLTEEHEHLIRLAAEFENYKKRTSRDFASLIKTASENLVLQLTPVLDNFERALNHSVEESTFDSFRQGLVMIFQQLKNIMENEGVKPIEVVGKPFDPDLHDALLQVEKEGYEPGIVIEEVEKGYTLNNKVIRHSKVIVSK